MPAMDKKAIMRIIRRYENVPFKYGVDCCAFVGDCVEELTGNNPMCNFSYDDEDTAYQIIDSFGTLEDAISATLQRLPYDGLKTGDICVIDSGDGRQAAGIIYGDRIVARVKTGLMDYPLSRALAIWEM